MKKLIILFFLLIPVSVNAEPYPKVSGTHAIAIERTSNRILFEKNAYSKTSIASTTKIMTSIVAVENNDLESVVIISKKAAHTAGSDINLKEGDQIKLSELLYGLMLRSGNDAAVAIAEHTSGSVEEFTKLMNQKANELGAFNTNFVTPHGLDTFNHYSTAYDMAIIANYALSNPTIAKLVSTSEYTMAYLDGKSQPMRNTNPLLSSYFGTTGVKTGYTGKAGRCLVASAKRDGMEIIVVVLGEPSSKLRITDSSKLLNYCFNNFSFVDLSKIYPINFAIPISKAKVTAVIPKYISPIRVPLTKTETENLIIKRHFKENITAPLKAGQILGKIQFLLNDEVVGELELVAPSIVKRSNPLDYCKNILNIFVDYKQYIL